MTKEEALKLALEALERVSTVDDECDIFAPPLSNAVVEAITAIKEALAQPEQEPKQVAHVYLLDSKGWPKVGWDDGRGIKVGDKLYTITSAEK